VKLLNFGLAKLRSSSEAAVLSSIASRQPKELDQRLSHPIISDQKMNNLAPAKRLTSDTISLARRICRRHRCCRRSATLVIFIQSGRYRTEM
jgi:hypothetical protein